MLLISGLMTVKAMQASLSEDSLVLLDDDNEVKLSDLENLYNRVEWVVLDWNASVSWAK